MKTMKVKDRQKLNKQLAKRVGAYGMIKRNEVLRFLSDAERDELDLLTVCENRSPLQAERLAELWNEARRLYDQQKAAETPADTAWFDEIKVKMWTKHGYDAYIAWMRLTHNGRRGRAQMSAAAQQEYDSWDFKREPPMTEAEAAEAKRLYEEATTGSAVPPPVPS